MTNSSIDENKSTLLKDNVMINGFSLIAENKTKKRNIISTTLIKAKAIYRPTTMLHDDHIRSNSKKFIFFTIFL